MKVYTLIFARNDNMEPTASLSVPEDGFVRTPTSQMLQPELIKRGDKVKVNPSPLSVQTVLDIIVEERV